jgi:acyl-CoA thioester hydrolase
VRYRIGVFAAGAEQTAAEGHFVHVYVGRESRRPVALPEEWRRVLEGIAS